MRRLFVILAGLAVVSTGLACQHTAGKCDCTLPLPHCTKYGLYTPEMASDSVAPRHEILPPSAPARMIPAGAVDIGEPISVIPSVAVSLGGD